MKLHRCLFALLLPALALAQPDPVQVTLDPACVRNIGGVTRFDRDQFITIHEAFGSIDMDDDDLHHLEEVLDARYGRDGGLLSWRASQVTADPKNPDMPDVAGIAKEAQKYRKRYAGRRMTPSHMRKVVLCTHPELMHARTNNTFAAWGPRTYEAVAEYTAQFLKLAFKDHERPRYLEVFNEPFVKARKMGTTVEALSEQHNVVAQRVRELNPNVLVGGYSAAWVEVESRNFEHWNSRQKVFMDIAGENMDFFSYHIYDGVNVKGTPRVRTGSNSEALMDLVDTYSHIKFGVAKPIMITEYGKIPEGNMGTMPYSAKRSAGMLYSFNGQLMTYLDHPDRLLRTIPFILGKATWTYNLKGKPKPGEANPFLLWRRLADGSFKETDLSLFYKFWKGVEGEWRRSASSNPDVRVQFLADGKRLTLVLANLDHEPKQVSLSGLEGVTPTGTVVRTLKTCADKPALAERRLNAIPKVLDLAVGQSAMLLIDTAETIRTSRTVKEHRVYATEYLKDIEAGKPVTFRFVNAPTGRGTAVLRLSPGRELGKQVLPSSVTFNGKKLPIPTNWAGGDQAGRANFFGMIELPVPADIIDKVNEVSITYPDTGGKVGCVVLQVNRREGL
jgi:hypothetical protein